MITRDWKLSCLILHTTNLELLFYSVIPIEMASNLEKVAYNIFEEDMKNRFY